MNINAINNQSFQAKMPSVPESRIKVTGKVNGYVEQMLNEGSAKLESIAETCKTKVNIAQKGDTVFVNAGPKTSLFNLSEMKHGNEFYENIISNIKENGNILARLS